MLIDKNKKSPLVKDQRACYCLPPLIGHVQNF